MGTCRLTDASGKFVATVDQRGALWQATFLEDIGGCGGVVEGKKLAKIDEKRFSVALDVQCSNETKGLPQNRSEWEDLLEKQAAKLKGRKAMGTELVPSELVMAAGRPLIRLLASITEKISKQCAPLIWTGGRMASVPRDARQPPTLQNTRDMLWSSALDKVVSGALRGIASPYLERAAGHVQHGARAGGG